MGLRDIMPDDALSVDKSEGGGERGSQGRFPYILIGMAVIAMCFNLMQSKVVQGVRSMRRKIGIIKD